MSVPLSFWRNLTELSSPRTLTVPSRLWTILTEEELSANTGLVPNTAAPISRAASVFLIAILLSFGLDRQTVWYPAGVRLRPKRPPRMCASSHHNRPEAEPTSAQRRHNEKGWSAVIAERASAGSGGAADGTSPGRAARAQPVSARQPIRRRARPSVLATHGITGSMGRRAN